MTRWPSGRCWPASISAAAGQAARALTQTGCSPTRPIPRAASGLGSAPTASRPPSPNGPARSPPAPPKASTAGDLLDSCRLGSIRSNARSHARVRGHGRHTGRAEGPARAMTEGRLTLFTVIARTPPRSAARSHAGAAASVAHGWLAQARQPGELQRAAVPVSSTRRWKPVGRWRLVRTAAVQGFAEWCAVRRSDRHGRTRGRL